MNDRDIFTGMMTDLKRMKGSIEILAADRDFGAGKKLLKRLRKNVQSSTVIVKKLQNEGAAGPQSEDGRIFTPEELARFNGKGGNPAYVAVNGTVYDVTNSAAWGGATHFGLAAGTDLTSQFAACHAGQAILSKLKAVGKMTG